MSLLTTDDLFCVAAERETEAEETELELLVGRLAVALPLTAVVLCFADVAVERERETVAGLSFRADIAAERRPLLLAAFSLSVALTLRCLC
mmetsp:Transcript_3674/g.12964  ORF Transcript_3674/g.12964 Transcript_3674/m.12964 type:complete len:91 (+) Transcript_3674:626-898(+)